MMEKKVTDKIGCQGTHHRHQHTDADNNRLRHHHDQDALFFSSTSTSSDSSSAGFSSSDTDSIYVARSRASCFAPPRPKPVRTTVSDKKERRHSAPFSQLRDFHEFDDYRRNPNAATHDEALIKSKSRALKIYNNLKKVKQPISPGGRLTNFLNSLFTPGNTKKSKTYEDANAERKTKSGQASASACSSASSFSRSCLSKTSPSSREKLRNGVKRSVHFYPVSVIVDEDSRPCGHKFLYEQKDHSLMMPVSVPTAWKIGRSPNHKNNQVEEAGREFLKEYLQNQKKNDFTLMDLPEDDDDDDDAASCSSSDLFELDHLTVMENGRYCEELPVYETTHVSTNRAIANGLIM